MSQLHADLPAVEHFAHRLRNFDETLAQEFEGLQASWQEVKYAWDDPVQRRFAEMFKEFTPSIRQYLDTASEYEIFLQEKIEALRDYDR